MPNQVIEIVLRLQPSTWDIVSAIAAVLALIAIFFEFRRARKELASRKVEGLEYAIRQLNGDNFQNALTLARDALRRQQSEYPDGMTPYLMEALFVVDFVERLASLGFVDKELLFYLYNDDFYWLDAAITNLENRKGTKIPELKATFPGAIAHLEQGSKYSRKSVRDTFARLSQERALQKKPLR